MTERSAEVIETKVVAHIPVIDGGVVVSEATGDRPYVIHRTGESKTQEAKLGEIGPEVFGRLATVAAWLPDDEPGSVVYRTKEVVHPTELRDGFTVKRLNPLED